MRGFLGVALVLSFLTTALAMKRFLDAGEDEMSQFSSSRKRPHRVLTLDQAMIPEIEEVSEYFWFEEPENLLHLTLDHFQARAGDGAEIFLSAYNGDIEMLSVLLSLTPNFSDLLYTTDQGKDWNLLEFAVALGSLDVCCFCLFRAEYAGQVEALKHSAMELAYVSGDKSIRALFDVRLPIPKKIHHPQFNFGIEHETGMIRSFLKTVNWSISAQDKRGMTALMYALDSNCSAALLEYLIETGFTADGQDKHGQTVFHKVVFWHGKLTSQKDVKLLSHNEKLVLPLIKMYPHLIDVPDNDGNTPLHYAMKKRNLADLCNTFIKAGATGEHTNLDGNWAIQRIFSDSSASKARGEMEMLRSVNQMSVVLAALFDAGSIFSMLPADIVITQLFSVFVLLRQDHRAASSTDAYVLLRCKKFPEQIAKHIMQFISSKTARMNLGKLFDDALLKLD